MKDISTFTWIAWRTTAWWKRCYEGLGGARVVSLFLRVFTGGLCWVVLWFCVVCFCSVFAGENSCIQLLFHFFCEFLVVDEQCPVLTRQCREKKKSSLSLSLFPPFSSASPLLGLHRLSRCLPKVAMPNVVAITQTGRLPPCRELSRVGAAYDLQPSSSAFPSLPSTVPVPTMLMDAVDHLLLGTLLTT